MRTSTAEENGYKCPKCGDEVSRDLADNGFVRHLNNPGCDFQRGERDLRDLAAAFAGRRPKAPADDVG